MGAAFREADPDTPRGSPHDLAASLDPFGLDQQQKRRWHGRFQLETRARLGQVANDAIERGRVVEQNGAALQAAQAGVLALFVHWKGRS
jgi:hypothetical protein